MFKHSQDFQQLFFIQLNLFIFIIRNIWVVLDIVSAIFLLYKPFLITKEDPGWVNLPIHKKRKYLKDTLKYDPWVGEESPDTEKIINKRCLPLG